MITAAILSYNGKEVISDCVNSIHNQSVKPTEILLIDNDSKDDCWKLVESKVDRIVHGNNEHGFITGLNLAFKEARFERVLFVSQDMILHPDCIKELAEYPINTIVEPRTFLPNGKHLHGRIYSQNFLTGIFMMSKMVFNYVGEFDVNCAPAFYEDLDYNIRAHRIGVETECGIFAKAIHNHEMGSFHRLYGKKGISYMCRKNFWYVMKKHYLSRVFPFLYNGKIFSNNKKGAGCG